MKNRITTNSSDAYGPAFGRHGFLVMKNRITRNSSDAYGPAFGRHGFLVMKNRITLGLETRGDSSGDSRC